MSLTADLLKTLDIEIRLTSIIYKIRVMNVDVLLYYYNGQRERAEPHHTHYIYS